MSSPGEWAAIPAHIAEIFEARSAVQRPSTTSTASPRPAAGPGTCSPQVSSSLRSPATPAWPPSAKKSSTRNAPSPVRSHSRSALLAAGPDALAASTAPLDTAVRAGDLEALSPVVRVGGTIAALGVLLSLIVGVSRTTFAMAANGEMPRWLDAVHPRHRVPHRAELVVGAVVLVADLRGAIGFSSFAVLAYYAIAKASAYSLPPHQRRWPRGLAVLGIAGCVVLALTLPAASVIGGLAVLVIGALVWAARAQFGTQT